MDSQLDSGGGEQHPETTKSPGAGPGQSLERGKLHHRRGSVDQLTDDAVLEPRREIPERIVVKEGEPEDVSQHRVPFIQFELTVVSQLTITY